MHAMNLRYMATGCIPEALKTGLRFFNKENANIRDGVEPE